MTSNVKNKALTISYGTFTITLEGFDDPFPIMKRVTEYFRRIASDDKTFGTLSENDQTRALDIIAKTLQDNEMSITTTKSGLVILPRADLNLDDDLEYAQDDQNAEIFVEDDVEANFDTHDFDTKYIEPDDTADRLILDETIPEDPYYNDDGLTAALNASAEEIDKFDTSRVFRRPLRIIRSTYEEPEVVLPAEETASNDDDRASQLLASMRGAPSLKFGVTEGETETAPSALLPELDDVVVDLPETIVAQTPSIEEPTLAEVDPIDEDKIAVAQSFKRIRLQLDDEAADEDNLVLVANRK
ncbi:hypothetical protein GCM10008927_20940 [Amylibacter ulvae]|uniref:Uncharacterized protein n=1 Tax=Paramylibacter ulvae TaxID=1651968 RepID=A0ABQ3D294_9RHOB|nr:hypothetical protein [Amylibacter ulvae]GHA54924.1 hypothetical protein GCM10008927_20940 [Amylibacter ulvae]